MEIRKIFEGLELASRIMMTGGVPPKDIITNNFYSYINGNKNKKKIIFSMDYNHYYVGFNIYRFEIYFYET